MLVIDLTRTRARDLDITHHITLIILIRHIVRFAIIIRLTMVRNVIRIISHRRSLRPRWRVSIRIILCIKGTFTITSATNISHTLII